MRKTVDIIGVPVDYVTMGEAIDRVRAFLNEEGIHTIFTPNAEIMMAAQRDKAFKEILKSSDMVVADGAGVVLASRILGVNLPERVPGLDLTKNTFLIEGKRKTRYFFLGGQPGVAEKAAENMTKIYPGIEMAGCQNGFFSKENEDQIIERINQSETDILLVALGAPKQEIWIAENRDKLKVKVCIGVGGSLDVFAGITKRAPEFYRKHNLEWFYRLCKEPRRFIRMLDLPRFMLLALAVKFRLKSPY